MAYNSRIRSPRVYALGLVVSAPTEAISKNGKSYKYVECQCLSGRPVRALVRESDSFSPGDCVCVSATPYHDDFAYKAYPLSADAVNFVKRAAAVYYTEEHLQK